MNWHNVKSSNLKAVAYFEGDVYVEFLTGSKYQYKDVPHHLFEELLAAESIGKFYIANIKRLHKAEILKDGNA
jgi:hypothetical protein